MEYYYTLINYNFILFCSLGLVLHYIKKRNITYSKIEDDMASRKFFSVLTEQYQISNLKNTIFMCFLFFFGYLVGLYLLRLQIIGIPRDISQITIKHLINLLFDILSFLFAIEILNNVFYTHIIKAYIYMSKYKVRKIKFKITTCYSEMIQNLLLNLLDQSMVPDVQSFYATYRDHMRDMRCWGIKKKSVRDIWYWKCCSYFFKVYSYNHISKKVFMILFIILKTKQVSFYYFIKYLPFFLMLISLVKDMCNGYLSWTPFAFSFLVLFTLGSKVRYFLDCKAPWFDQYIAGFLYKKSQLKNYYNIIDNYHSITQYLSLDLNALIEQIPGFKQNKITIYSHLIMFLTLSNLFILPKFDNFPYLQELIILSIFVINPTFVITYLFSFFLILNLGFISIIFYKLWVKITIILYIIQISPPHNISEISRFISCYNEFSNEVKNAFLIAFLFSYEDEDKEVLLKEFVEILIETADQQLADLHQAFTDAVKKKKQEENNKK